MKINLPVFKDEDTKDAVTYQRLALGLDNVSSCWVSRLHPPPHAIHSLQDNPGELVRSSGTDITLDDVLIILDECHNNIKALDALN